MGSGRKTQGKSGHINEKVWYGESSKKKCCLIGNDLMMQIIDGNKDQECQNGKDQNKCDPKDRTA